MMTARWLGGFRAKDKTQAVSQFDLDSQARKVVSRLRKAPCRQLAWKPAHIKKNRLKRRHPQTLQTITTI